MAQTYIRLSQIRKPDDFTDNLTPAQIAGIEASSVDYDDFLTGILSQINRIVGDTNWFDEIEDVATDPRSLKTLTDDIYYKKTLKNRLILTNITVPASQNYKVLSQAGSETPSVAVAVGTSSANGTVVSELPADVGTHSLNEVAGLNAIAPKNLVIVRNATTFDPITSSDREIYGLLQVENGVTDGTNFNDTTAQGQISFVRVNTAGNDLEAVPVADIENQVIVYWYACRTDFHLMNEQDFLTSNFLDSQTVGSNTLQEAYVGGNQIDVLTAEGNLVVDLSQDTTEFQALRNGANFFRLIRNDTTGDQVIFDTDDFIVNNANTATYLQGISVDTAVASNTINIGATANQIDSEDLDIVASVNNIDLSAAQNITFQTAEETTALPLDDATTGAISALPGGPYASVAAAISAALGLSNFNFFSQVLGSDFAANANVPGLGNWSTALDLTGRNIVMTGAATANLNTIMYYNGQLLTGGAGNDWIIGDTPANGDVKFLNPDGVYTGDTLVVCSWAV